MSQSIAICDTNYFSKWLDLASRLILIHKLKFLYAKHIYSSSQCPNHLKPLPKECKYGFSIITHIVSFWSITSLFMPLQSQTFCIFSWLLLYLYCNNRHLITIHFLSSMCFLLKIVFILCLPIITITFVFGFYAMPLSYITTGAACITERLKTT